MTKYLLLIVIALTIALGISVKTCSDKAKDRDRLSGNQTALMNKARFYRTNDSLSTVSVQRLQLTVSELQENKSFLSATIKVLNIKLKRVNSVSTTATESNYSISPQVKETIVYRDGKTDTIRCIDYSDKWLAVSGCESQNKYNGLQILSRDTTVQIAHRVPKKFWFIRYGTKAVRMESINKNPHSTIVFQEYIELTK